MLLFFDILLDVTLPIVVVVVFGWITQLKLALNADTLKSLLINVILPCFFIHYLSTSELPLIAAWPISWFTALQFLVLLAVGWGIATALRFDPDVRPIFALALALPNTGNYGVPLATLVFDPAFLLHQAVIVAVQTAMIIFAGQLLLSNNSRGVGTALKEVVLSPMIWGILIGLILRGFDITLPKALGMPVKLIGDCYAAIALFALGVSLAGQGRHLKGAVVQLTVWCKLILTPALTLALVWMCGFRGEDLVFLVVASSTPVGVFLAIICMQHRGESRLASGAVFLSTVLSPLTITAWLLLLRTLSF